ncbi:MAG: hypothetical protein HY759_04700 [Nitrospirae bacterium]|nr:hypothetical protein [Nitrospirota bacterium]
MTANKKYELWFVSADDLKDVTPKKARDIIIKCFFDAQKATFAMAGEKLGKKPNEKELYGAIKSEVKKTFNEAKCDFENPTKENLRKVVDLLYIKSASLGTPKEVRDHHKGQIEMVLRRLDIFGQAILKKLSKPD